jgi:hypothetical protein
MNRSRTILDWDKIFDFSVNTIQIKCSSKIEQIPMVFYVPIAVLYTDVSQATELSL